jgi:hypothetical protein
MYDVFPKYDSIPALSSMSAVLLLIPDLQLFLAGQCDNFLFVADHPSIPLMTRTSGTVEHHGTQHRYLGHL